MAPPQRYADAVAQLGPLLAAARRRGEPFAVAWRAAVHPAGAAVLTCTPNPPAGAIRWSSDNAKRIAQREAIDATREAWRRAYEHAAPTRADLAIVALLPALGDFGRVEETAEFQAIA